MMLMRKHSLKVINQVLSLTGVLGTLVALNPYTTIVSAVLYILTAIATVEATKTKYRN